MPTLEFFLVCRAVTRDLFTDEITLSGVLEDIVLEADGMAQLPSAVAVAAWNAEPKSDPTDLQVMLRITRPGETKGLTFPMNLAKGHNRYRAIFAISGIPLAEPGELLFEVLLNAEPCASHRVFVHPPGSAPPTPPFPDELPPI